MEIELKKCNRCKMNLKVDEFKQKRDGTYQKYCIECNKHNCKYRKTIKCEHGRERTKCIPCKELGTGGNHICIHNNHKSQCIPCRELGIGGGSFCDHKRIRAKCKLCKELGIGGGYICVHNKEKSTCANCDPVSYLSGTVRGSIRHSLKSNKSRHSHEYLGINIQEYRDYLESKLLDGMSWDNYGTIWEIDHITPLKYKNPTIEQVIERLHYTNTQPLWKEMNIAKSNRYVSVLDKYNYYIFESDSEE